MDPWLTRITDYLLAQSWQIALLTVAVAIVSFLLRNRSAHVRYLLWLIVLAKCLVPPLYSVPVAVLPQEGPPAHIPPPPIPERMVTEHRAPRVAVTEPARPASVQTETDLPAKVPGGQPMYSIGGWLAIGWFVGAVALLFYYLVNAVRTQYWLQKKRKVLPVKSRGEIDAFLSANGIKHIPCIWLLEGISQPFVWGLVQGSIYLPVGFLSKKKSKFWTSVLGHELSHVLRFDAAVNSLQVVSQILFWFHPFVWWANKRIRAEREKCCDEMTIVRMNSLPEDYSEGIVEILAAKYEQSRPIPSLAVASPVKNVEERIKTMLKPGKKFYKRPSIPVATVVTLTALLAAPTTIVLTVRAQDPLTGSTNAGLTFDDPTNLGPSVNSSARDYDPSISTDELELYFNSYRSGGLGQADIWVTTRKTKDAPWDTPVNLGPPVNSAAGDKAPSISADGLSLYFSSDRSGGYGYEDLWVTTRKTKNALWSEPVNLGPKVNSAAREHAPSISTDGLELYFSGIWESTESQRPGGSGGADIWVTKRQTKDAPWGTPVNLGPIVNSSTYDESPSISGSGLSLYFHSYRPGGFGGADIWVTNRKSTSDPWDRPVNLGSSVNSANWENNPDISRDGSTLYLVSNRPGDIGGANDRDIWQATLARRTEDTSTDAAQPKLPKSFHQAAADGDIEQVKKLIAQGADIDAKEKGDKGQTPLQLASENGHVEIARLLIARGADINKKTGGWDLTALHVACVNGQVEVIKLLVANGADLNMPCAWGDTPFSYALISGMVIDKALLELFVEKGVSVPPIHLAAYSGDLAEVKRLVGEGVNINSTGPHKLTALHFAVHAGQFEVTEYLLSQGADINARDNSDRTPLHYTAIHSDAKIAGLLVANGADLGALSRREGTPLHMAVEHRQKSMIELLVSKGADINRKSRDGHPALLWALWTEDVETLTLLISKGADINANDSFSDGYTPLHWAVLLHSTDLVKLLIASGANLNNKDKKSRTALDLAKEQGQAEIMELLRKHGAIEDASFSPENAESAEFLYDAPAAPEEPKSAISLHEAAKLGDLAEVKRLIAAGADVNAADHKHEDELTSLCIAAGEGHAEIVKALLEHGAKVDVKDAKGYTALFYAVWSEDEQTVKILINNGANVNLTAEGFAPLYHAVWQDQTAIVGALLNAGANAELDAPEGSPEGWSPLQTALEIGNPGTVTLLANADHRVPALHKTALKGDLSGLKELLRKGADLNEKDELGRTPIYYALAAGQGDVASFLLDQGADISLKTTMGRTLLHQASRAGLLQIVQVLLARDMPAGTDSDLGTPLHEAAGAGHKEIAELLISKGAPVDSKSRVIRTPLHMAAAMGEIDMVTFLLAKGADVNTSDSQGRTPLSLARQRGYTEVVKFLQQHGAKETLHGAVASGDIDPVREFLSKGHDVNEGKQIGNTPLHVAINLGQKAIVELLIAEGADIEAREGRWDNTPLIYASSLGRRDIAELLVSKGADIEARLEVNGFTPLIMAVARDRIDVVEMLLEKGANVNATDNNGATPLHYAVGSEHQDTRAMTELFLSRGADVNAETKEGRTPLSIAQEKGHTDIVELLKKHGEKEATSATLGKSESSTSLHQAALDGNIEQVKELIAQGADVNGDTYLRRPLFHHIVAQGNKTMVKLLLSEGVDVSARDEEGATALHAATNPEIGGLLLQAGANADARDNRGRTALHKTAWQGREDVADVLLARGATTGAKDNQGRTPLHWAAEYGRPRLVERLLAQGAEVDARDNEGRTPLYLAFGSFIPEDQKAVVRLLASRGGGVPTAYAAAYLGDLTKVKEVVQAGFRISSQDESGFTLLHAAAKGGQTETVEWLLTSGAKVNARAEGPWANKLTAGWTPLHCAAAEGNTEVVKLLIARGANIEATDILGATPLHASAKYGRRDAAEALIALGADVERPDAFGTRPLHAAASGAALNQAVTELLIAQGADVNAKDKRLGTPLHLSVISNYKNIAELLIDNGADVNARGVESYEPFTSLYWAVISGYTEMVTLLVERGADINVQVYDDTPLHAATSCGSKEMVKLLIDHGAKVNAKDEDGRTSLSIAAQKGYVEIATLLRQHGAQL